MTSKGVGDANGGVESRGEVVTSRDRAREAAEKAAAAEHEETGTKGPIVSADPIGAGTHRGLVAPMILRPVLTTSLPSQTMHTTGPEHM